MKTHRKTLAINLFFLALNFFILRNVLGIGGFQSADLDVAWMNGLQRLAFSWSFQQLGGPSSPSGIFFIGSFLSSILGLATAEKVLYYLPLFLVPLGAYYLLRNLGLSEAYSLVLSFVYEVSPWFIGQFMNGEPVFVWLFALLPIVFYIALNVLKNRRPSNYLALALVLSLAIMFTLQSIIVYFFLLAPLFITAAFYYRKSFVKPAVMMLGVSALAVLINAYSTGAYLNAASGLIERSGSNLTALFGAFQSALAQYLRIWLVLFLGLSFICLLLIMQSRNRNYTAFAVATMGLEAFFTGIYLAIPSGFVAYLYWHVPFFTPYQNWDKFLLMGWFYTFSLVIVAIMAYQRGGPGRSEEKIEHQSIRPSATVLKRNNAATMFVLLVIVGILLSSAFFINIQSQTYINGANFVQGRLSFQDNQIPQYYYQIIKFLDSQNVSYSLSPHTLIVPQNPGSIIPFYVGENNIPGFVGGIPQLYQVLQGISENQSTTTVETMSLMGIKYIVIINESASSWPGANGPASVGGWGGGYFPQGSAASYAKILGSWPLLAKAYSGSNFTVFENEEYVSPVIYINKATYEELAAANPSSLIFLSTTPIGPSLISNPGLEGMTGWSFNRMGGNATYFQNGTVILLPGSKGASVSQNVLLKPDQWYEISLYVSTNPGYGGFPPNGMNRNYVGLWWNGGTGFAGNPGAYIGGYFNGNFSGYVSFIFQAPNSTDPVPAQFGLNYEPPIGNKPIFTTYSNVTLIPINGSNLFTEKVVPVSIKQSTPTSIKIINGSSYPSGYIQLDTLYNRNWVAALSNGSVEEGESGLFGLETFYITGGEYITSIYYSSENLHYYELLFTWTLLALIVALYLLELIKGK